MWEFLTFLGKAVVISLSGVLAPGAITAATLAAGARNRHAGALIAVGHGIIEFPLMLLIVLGAGWVLQLVPMQIAIGLTGGAFLLATAVGMFRSVAKVDLPEARPTRWGPLMTGVMLSASNPYFLLWWASVGLALATEAAGLGIWAFAIFAVVHWTLDLVWLWALTLAAHKGTTLLGPKLQKGVLIVCGIALVLFAGRFIYGAVEATGILEDIVWSMR